MKRLLFFSILLAGCTSIPRQTVRNDHSADTPYDLVEGSPMYKLIPNGAIPAIDKPEWDSVEDALAYMEPEEPVLVLERGDDVRIYSTWYLEAHEIVNDEVQGEALLVSW